MNLRRFKSEVVEGRTEDELRHQVGTILQVVEMPIQYVLLNDWEVPYRPLQTKAAKRRLLELLDLLDEGPARRAAEKIFAFFVRYPLWMAEDIYEAYLWASALRHLLGISLGRSLIHHFDGEICEDIMG